MTTDTATTQARRWKLRSRVVAGASALALTALGIQASPAFAEATVPTTTTITCTGAPTYDGTAHEICTYVVEDDATNLVDSGSLASGDYSNNTDAGTASASFSYAGDATYLPSSDSTTFEIAKATPNVTVTGYSVTYDGTEHTATVSISGENGETDATVGTVDVSTTALTNVGDGTLTWDFVPTANYEDVTGLEITYEITKATPTVVVTGYDVDYDGNSHTATYTVTGVGEESGETVGSVDVSGTTHTEAGTYAGDTWTFAPTGNYEDVPDGTVDNEINSLTISTGTYTGAIAVPYGARMALKSSFSIPNVCPTDVYSYEFSDDNGNNYNYYTSDGGVLQTPYTTAVLTSGLPSGPYLVRANYKGNSNCNQAYSDTPGFVVYDASTAAYGGGQYVSNGRANFGFEYHAATRTRAAGGNLVWNWKGQWRFKGKLNAYGKRTSGTLGGRNCTSTNPCGAFTGTGTLFYYDSESLTWVSVGSGITVNVAAIQTTTTAKNSSPGYVGFSFGYIPATGQPSLPSNALISLQKSNNGGGGVISLK